MGRLSIFLAAFGRGVRGVLDALWRALSSDPDDRPWERAAVRIVVPFAFVSAGLVSTFVAYRTGRPPAVAFHNHLIFAGELLLLGFYGVLLVLVPLVRAMASGELPVELTAKGARFSEEASEESVVAKQEIAERVASLENDLADQAAQDQERARRVTQGMLDFGSDLENLRDRFDEFERRAG
jgi:hypothetical protein